MLLDEDVPHPLARQLPGHEVSTVASLGWSGIKNGELLKLAAAEGFEVFVTGDKNLQSQQDLAGRPFGIVLLSAINWPVIRKHLPAIADAVASAVPGTVQAVHCGTFKPNRQPWSGQS